ncbi:MAG: biotin/lipoyl-containing protein [Fimbriimonadaceae bacterium]
MAELETAAIRHALQIARDNGYTEVELELDGQTFRGRLARSAPPARSPRVSGSAPEAARDPGDGRHAVLAPCVGFFAGGKRPLEVGMSVVEGEIVASIEALGLGNDVVSPVAGEVVEVLVSPGDPVEFGQTIAWVQEAK